MSMLKVFISKICREFVDTFRKFTTRYIMALRSYDGLAWALSSDISELRAQRKRGLSDEIGKYTFFTL